MTNILQIHHHPINPSGSGGHHRSYQIHFDILSSIGSSNTSNLLLNQPDTEILTKAKVIRHAVSRRVSFSKLVLKSSFNPKKVFNALLTEDGVAYKSFEKVSVSPYQDYISTYGKPNVCIVDSPIHLPVIQYNRNNQIKTIYCPQNLDSFDLCAHKVQDQAQRSRFALKWMTELEALAACDERMMISQLETGVIKGLGLSAVFYPYLPVGEIRENLLKIRARRSHEVVDPRLLLMFGSITHQTTFVSFQWFLKNALKYRLQENLRIIVAGRGGERLAKEFQSIQGIEILSYIEQAKLENLLAKVSAVLIPQFSGFGAVTRILEMACAGIPTIVSKHPTAAMELPPGVTVVDDDWAAWMNAIDCINMNISANTLEEYVGWESRQPKPVYEVLNKFL